MRPLTQLLQLPRNQLSKVEKQYVDNYKRLKRVKHSSTFIYHSRKLPEEPNGHAN